MNDTILQKLAQAPIVPLINEEEPQKAAQIAEALGAGGLSVIEVVMRSTAAQAGMEAILEQSRINHSQGAIIGAGTVLTLNQAKSVIASGAQFIVSPGLDEAIAHYCMAEGIAFFPGIMTPGEAQRAYAMGLCHVKFFPASLAGGLPMLKALASVFTKMRFMPTGGVGPSNLADYLAQPSVFACGGSWLVPKEAVGAGDYEAITRLASEAIDLARKAE